MKHKALAVVVALVALLLLFYAASNAQQDRRKPGIVTNGTYQITILIQTDTQTAEQLAKKAYSCFDPAGDVRDVAVEEIFY